MKGSTPYLSNPRLNTYDPYRLRQSGTARDKSHRRGVCQSRELFNIHHSRKASRGSPRKPSKARGISAFPTLSSHPEVSAFTSRQCTLPRCTAFLSRISQALPASLPYFAPGPPTMIQFHPPKLSAPAVPSFRSVVGAALSRRGFKARAESRGLRMRRVRN